MGCNISCCQQSLYKMGCCQEDEYLQELVATWLCCICECCRSNDEYTYINEK